MVLKFGTSGVRGLVTEMTNENCSRFARAFARYLTDRKCEKLVLLGGDCRSSTERILAAVAQGFQKEDFRILYCGRIPTPALVAYAMARNLPSAMVTGSHIPDDRNGIKFNLPWGEVLKSDEAEILDRYQALEANRPIPDSGLEPLPSAIVDASEHYRRRYLQFFPPASLQGLRIVLYQHSTVAREALRRLLEDLGAEVVPVGWSDRFIPVDTEAVEDLPQLTGWVNDHRADALVSADGDGDRPLVVDEQGRQLRGDVLGILVARYLEAESVTAPVSCNTALEKSGWFAHTQRTRIGSPFVIEAMSRAVWEGRRRVVGYEANGGFLTATEIPHPTGGGELPALPTRDAALPILSVLALTRMKATSLSGLRRELPAVYTYSGILRKFGTETGQAIVGLFAKDGVEAARKYFGAEFGCPVSIDQTDGARITFEDGRIVHLRPSGNAPEFRCYTEDSTEQGAAEINAHALRIVKEKIVPPVLRGSR